MRGENSIDATNKILRKIYVDPGVVSKMKKLSSLYSDELPENAKEIDILSFFFEKSFKQLLESGEIEKKVEEIKK